ncbi:odorant receptor 7a-like isoform X2 [Cotesia glomerata]|uniref:odorant receptor 7a-like isoform X2 n=1 Tax=Cotesia glomerata TaxID=32391 RepID=UPI001D022CFE|nr:odorant receptor 7a-like isoform X2 [Cotesia glomerata]
MSFINGGSAIRVVTREGTLGAEQENSKLSWTNNRMDFEDFIDSIFNAISYSKFWKKNSLSLNKAIVNTALNIILLTLIVLLCASEVIGTTGTDNLTSFGVCVCQFLFHFAGLCKWVIIILKSDDVKDILIRIKRCHEICRSYNKTQKEFFEYSQKIDKFKSDMITFAKLWSLLCICGAIEWCLNPLIYDCYNIYILKIPTTNYTRSLPFEAYIPWTIDSNKKYIMTFAFQFISGIAASIGMVISDVLNVIFLANISFNLEFLNITLVKENKNFAILRFSDSDMAIKKFKSKLRTCLIHHREILKFVDQLNNLSSQSVFILCFTTTAALCLLSFVVAMFKIEPTIECIVRLTSIIEFWFGVTVDLFLFSFLATRIEERGLTTADAIYACNWEQSMANYDGEFTGDHRQTILDINQMISFSLMRAQKPITFQGGLFYVLSLETFKALSGFSLSNAVVLRQLSEET